MTLKSRKGGFMDRDGKIVLGIFIGFVVTGISTVISLFMIMNGLIKNITNFDFYVKNCLWFGINMSYFIMVYYVLNGKLNGKLKKENV